MSGDMNVATGSPESQSNISQKSVEVPSNNNESVSESHTPPLPTEKLESPQSLIIKRKSRFEDAPPNESDKAANKTSERLKQEEKQNSKKSNEWDMFAEADNIGDFNVCSLYDNFVSFLLDTFLIYQADIHFLSNLLLHRARQSKENVKEDQTILV